MKNSIIFIKNRFPERGRRILKGTAAFLFWIFVWALIARIVDQSVLLPSPAAVFKKLITFGITGEYWLTILESCFRIFIGYISGLLAGLITAFLCSRSTVATIFISPLLSVIRSVPVASFIILALVWIGRTNVPAFIALLMVFPIISGNVYEGFSHIDKELKEVAQIYRFGFLKRFRTLDYPAVLPYFLSGAKTSLGLAWKAGVAAEVLCSLRNSIGGKIYDSKLYLETDSLFAWTITLIIISMTIEKLVFRVKPADGTTRKGEEHEENRH